MTETQRLKKKLRATREKKTITIAKTVTAVERGRARRRICYDL